MAATINTNIASINAQRNLALSGQSLNTTMQRLSSGLRVNSAKDDAAGLAIAERMNTQVKGLTVAARNANDGISLAQTAEGALGKVGDMLQRMRELAVQASNATNSDSDRAALQAEVSQLAAEIDRVAKQTNFNGQKILDGSFAGAVFQVGANSGDNVTLGALADTRSSQISTINYGTSKLSAIDTDDITDPSKPAIAKFAEAIPAKALKITVGTIEVPLEEIKPANSSLERLGQVVTAINNKTADTGVTAYLSKIEGTMNYDLVFVSEKVDATQVPMEVKFDGFSQETTGIGWNSSLTPTAYEKNTELTDDTLFPASASTDADDVKAASAVADDIISSPLAQTNPDLAAAIKAFNEAKDATFTDTNDVQSALEPLIAAYAAAQKTVPGALSPSAYDKNVELTDDTLFPASASTDADDVKAASAVADDIISSPLAQTNPDLAAAIKAFNEAKDATFTDTNDVQSALEPLIAAYAAAQSAELSRAPMDMHDPLTDFETNVRGIEDIDVTTQEGAWIALKKIDSAIDQITGARATLGAMQARFETAVNNIDVQVENLSAARGRIMDADFAVETANLSRTQILQQAGTAMVAQANQIPQNVLQLLQG